LTREAAVIEDSIDEILNEGYRTDDIMGEGKTKVGTHKMGDLIVEKISKTHSPQ
jgi:3-isopropylmalate dehydrogenase